jgi:hypothetical protein
MIRAAKTVRISSVPVRGLFLIEAPSSETSPPLNELLNRTPILRYHMIRVAGAESSNTTGRAMKRNPTKTARNVETKTAKMTAVTRGGFSTFI